MKVIEDTYFDESVDGFVPIVSGVYPAHVSKLETISFDSGSTVFNVTFRLSEECKKINVNKMIQMAMADTWKLKMSQADLSQ